MSKAKLPERMQRRFRGLCLEVYGELREAEAAGELPDVDTVFNSVGVGWLYPGWVTNLDNWARDSTTLLLLCGVLRETLSMIIRGDIPDCSERVFRLLLESFWGASVRNNPEGPSPHNDIYDVYSEIRKNEDRAGSSDTVNKGLGYLFWRLIPDMARARDIFPNDALWVRISIVFYDLCRRQDKLGWGEFKDGIGVFLSSLGDKQLSLLKGKFLRSVLVDEQGGSDVFVNPLGVIQALLVYAETPGGEPRFTRVEKNKLKGAFLENLKPLLDDDSDYMLDAVSIESVLRAHADLRCPFRLTDRELAEVIQICRDGCIEPVLLSSGAMSLDEFYKVFKRGGGMGKSKSDELPYELCMLGPGWVGVAERFIEALALDLEARGENPKVLKKHLLLAESPVEEWIFRRGRNFPQATLKGHEGDMLLLGKSFGEYRRTCIRRSSELVTNTLPGVQIGF